jgi:ribose-phosphate pyrophosphokinase
VAAVHAFADSVTYARQIARRLRVPCAPVRVHRFPDGETLIHVQAPAPRDAILVRSLDDPDRKLIEVLLAADALRRAGARRITLVVPYMPYMRQDKVFEPGEPISQRVIGTLLGNACDALLTLEPHLHRVRRLAEVVPCRARALSAAPAIAEWVGRHARGALVAGPDAESEPWVRAVAQQAGTRYAVGRKERFGDRRVRVHFDTLAAPPRRAVLIDDIASSGATLAAAALALSAAGVRAIDAVVVHAIFAPGALALMRRADARRIVSCDTITHPTNAIRSAPLFAAALENSR